MTILVRCARPVCTTVDEDRPNMYFPVQLQMELMFIRCGPGGCESRWRCGPKTYKATVRDNMIVWKQCR